jgi:hypothetical protein
VILVCWRGPTPIEHSGTIQREVEKLYRVGLLTVTKIGNQKHYQVNPESPIFHELRGIVRKTFGVAGELCRVMNVNYFYRSTTIIIPVLLPQ